ncbi:MAG: hypothetical protein ACE5E4_11680 [Candidatus Binatia bacterium]
MKTVLVTILATLVLAYPQTSMSAWNPDSFADETTLELLTVGSEEGEHWFKVWLVVLNGEVYVRLGSRSVERINANTSSPYLGVRIAGEVFPKVRADPAPEMVERVATAMADKYFSDLWIRHFSHPLTMRLRAE